MMKEGYDQLDDILQFLETNFYSSYSWKITDLNINSEGKAYHACQYVLERKIIYSRLSNITPKKIGQFVTFWKRNKDGITTPFTETDNFDFLCIQVKLNDKLGQFVFPKSILIQKGILTTQKKDGKRGFRVYPKWDKAISKQAISTQKWQLKYFIELNKSTDLQHLKSLYLSK